MTEDQARLSNICPSCGAGDCKSLVVCWTCFKYTDNGWKEADQEWETWLLERHEAKHGELINGCPHCEEIRIDHVQGEIEADNLEGQDPELSGDSAEDFLEVAR